MLAGRSVLFNFGPDEKARLVAREQNHRRDGLGGRAAESGRGLAEIANAAARRRRPGGGGGADGVAAAAGGGGNMQTASAAGSRPQMFAQADKDADKKVTRSGIHRAGGRLVRQARSRQDRQAHAGQFGEKLYDAVPPLDGEPAAAAARGPSRTTAPAIFAVADADKDGIADARRIEGRLHQMVRRMGHRQSRLGRPGRIAEGLDAAIPPQPGGGGGRGRRWPAAAAGWWRARRVRRGHMGHAASHQSRRPRGTDHGFPDRLAAYDPKTGKQLWMSKGIGGTIYTTPVWGEGALFASTSGQGGGPAIAVKPGGTGDVTESSASGSSIASAAPSVPASFTGGHLSPSDRTASRRAST